MINQSDTPETDKALYPMNGVDIVWPEFARKLERERDQLKRWTSVNGVIELERERDEARTLERERNDWKALATQYSAEREHNAMQALAYKADRDEARADAIRWQSIAEGRGRTDDEADNDTQAELAAWEMLKEARDELSVAYGKLDRILNLTTHEDRWWAMEEIERVCVNESNETLQPEREAENDKYIWQSVAESCGDSDETFFK